MIDGGESDGGPGPPPFARLRASTWCAAALGGAVVALAGPRAGAEEAPPPAIVVHGQRHPRAAPRDGSVSGELVAKERLEAPGQTAATALRGMPGVAITELGGLGSSATASVRGATAAQTPVYLGGIRVNDEVAGSADLATLPLWFVERVELYRGNAPADADRWGPGGSLHFEPRNPDGRWSFGALAGSRATRGGYVTASAGDAAEGVIAGVGFEAADNDYGFDDSQGTAFVAGDDAPAELANADAALFGAWLHARRRIANGALRLLAHHGSLERGVARLANVPAEHARERLERRLVALATRTPLSDEGAWVEARTTLLASGTEVRDPARELGLGTTWSETRGVRVSQGLALRLEPLAGVVVRTSLDASGEQLSRHELGGLTGGPASVLEATRLDLRPALSTEVSLGPSLSIRALAAVECTSASTARLTACSERPLSGRVGPTLRHGNWLLFANAGRYARSPTLGERFGMSPVVRGNPRLDSERGATLDAGVRYHDAAALGAWLSGAAYARWASELIAFTRTAQGYVVPENRDRARVTGVELALGAEPLDGLALELAVTATDARDTSPSRLTANDVLPFQSRLVAAPGVSFTRAFDRPALAEIALLARYVHQSSRYADGAGLAVIPEQGSLELVARAELLRRALSVAFRWDNTLNQQRFDVVGFPLPGTSGFLSIEARH